jgi:hypothetical protein
MNQVDFTMDSRELYMCITCVLAIILCMLYIKLHDSLVCKEVSWRPRNEAYGTLLKTLMEVNVSSPAYVGNLNKISII